LEIPLTLLFEDEVVILDFFVPVVLRLFFLLLVVLRLVVFLCLRVVLAVRVKSLRLMLPTLALLSASKESMPDDVEG
jgi:hypothetical protein